MNKMIITVIGKDTVGIIAEICTYLARNSINIMDISQTIVDGYFNMMMVVDGSATMKSAGDVGDDLALIGKGIGVDIHCQSSEIFEKMHRI